MTYDPSQPRDEQGQWTDGLETGKPADIEALHGTRKDFDSFDQSRAGEETQGGLHQQILLTTNLEEAKFYTEPSDNDGNVRQGDTPQILHTKVHVENPLVVEVKGNPTNYFDQHQDQLIRQMDGGDHDAIIVQGDNDGRPERVISVPSGDQIEITKKERV